MNTSPAADTAELQGSQPTVTPNLDPNRSLVIDLLFTRRARSKADLVAALTDERRADHLSTKDANTLLSLMMADGQLVSTRQGLTQTVVKAEPTASSSDEPEDVLPPEVRLEFLAIRARQVHTLLDYVGSVFPLDTHIGAVRFLLGFHRELNADAPVAWFRELDGTIGLFSGGPAEDPFRYGDGPIATCTAAGGGSYVVYDEAQFGALLDAIARQFSLTYNGGSIGGPWGPAARMPSVLQGWTQYLNTQKHRLDGEGELLDPNDDEMAVMTVLNSLRLFDKEVIPLVGNNKERRHLYAKAYEAAGELPEVPTWMACFANGWLDSRTDTADAPVRPYTFPVSTRYAAIAEAQGPTPWFDRLHSHLRQGGRFQRHTAFQMFSPRPTLRRLCSVYGPGGTGKTTLVKGYAILAGSAGSSSSYGILTRPVDAVQTQQVLGNLVGVRVLAETAADLTASHLHSESIKTFLGRSTHIANPKNVKQFKVELNIRLHLQTTNDLTMTMKGGDDAVPDRIARFESFGRVRDTGSEVDDETMMEYLTAESAFALRSLWAQFVACRDTYTSLDVGEAALLNAVDVLPAWELLLSTVTHSPSTAGLTPQVALGQPFLVSPVQLSNALVALQPKFRRPADQQAEAVLFKDACERLFGSSFQPKGYTQKAPRSVSGEGWTWAGAQRPYVRAIKVENGPYAAILLRALSDGSPTYVPVPGTTGSQPYALDGKAFESAEDTESTFAALAASLTQGPPEFPEDSMTPEELMEHQARLAAEMAEDLATAFEDQ